MTADSFNPYRHWLGVEIGDATPNHYQLLRLNEFESNSEIILQGFQRQESILSGIQGDHSELAKELLEQIGEARLCLLSEDRKSEYDRTLKAERAVISDDGPLPLNTVSNRVPSSEPPEIPAQMPPPLDETGTPEITQPELLQDPTHASPVPVFAGDLQADRIKSQKAKESQDEKLKLWFDRLLWLSCGVCLIVIASVIISRSSGCNREPIVVTRNSDSKTEVPKVNSQRLRPKKRLKAVEVSPTVPTPPEKTRQSTANSLKTGSKGAGPPYMALDETIGFFTFDEKTRDNDIVEALASLQITNAKWKKEQSGGYLELGEKSRLTINRKQAFDHLKALTIIGRFKTSSRNRVADLVAVKNQVFIRLDQGQIQLLVQGTPVGEKYGSNLANNQWHRFAVIFGPEDVRFELDGQRILEKPLGFPDFRSFEETPTSIGFNVSGDQHHFVGGIDDVGFFWRGLSSDEVNALLE